MNAELIAVGSELLLGDIIDTNTAWLARKLRDHGINLYHRTVVGDNRSRLIFLLRQAIDRSDLVIVTGGLGPTYDDITKACLAEVAGVKIVVEDSIVAEYESYFKRNGKKPTKNNIQQAEIPEGADVYVNPAGLAPGIGLTVNDCQVILLPGPPHEMTATFDTSIVPVLFQDNDSILLSHTVHLYGVGEAEVDAALHDWMQQAENPTVAPYVHNGEIVLRVRTYAGTKTEAEEKAAPMIKYIKTLFKDNVYGVDVGSLENAVGIALRNKGFTLSTAESCSGGLVAKRITDIPGASDYFYGGVCTYSNAAKESILGVRSQTLATYGAVSEETAREMAIGAQQLYTTDCSIAITGIAGPGGGTAEKPVGLVWIAIAIKDNVYVERFQASPLIETDRAAIRNACTKHALFKLWQFLR